MKISDEELQAALMALARTDAGDHVSAAEMRSALEAAYTVRKARKAAKRAKAKPSILDEDQQEAMGQGIPALSYQSWYGNGELFHSAQAVPEPVKTEQPEHRFKVGDRVVHMAFGEGVVVRTDSPYDSSPYFVSLACGIKGWSNGGLLTPEPTKPEWNGKFEVGKAYRTRDGERAEIEGTLSGSYQFHGYVGNKSNGRVWTDCGKILDVFKFNHADDLIGPWED